MKNIINIILAFLTLFLFSCSCGKKVEQQKNKVSKIEKKNPNIKVDEINSWVNLMPGAESKFFISGNLIIDKSDLKDSAAINSLKIIQNKKVIYEIFPKFEVENNSENTLLKFFNDGGERISDQLNFDDFITAEFNLILQKKETNFKVDSIKIERTY